MIVSASSYLKFSDIYTFCRSPYKCQLSFLDILLIMSPDADADLLDLLPQSTSQSEPVMLQGSGGFIPNFREHLPAMSQPLLSTQVVNTGQVPAADTVNGDSNASAGSQPTAVKHKLVDLSSTSLSDEGESTAKVCHY